MMSSVFVCVLSDYSCYHSCVHIGSYARLSGICPSGPFPAADIITLRPWLVPRDRFYLCAQAEEQNRGSTEQHRGVPQVRLRVFPEASHWRRHWKPAGCFGISITGSEKAQMLTERRKASTKRKLASTMLHGFSFSVVVRICLVW